MTRNAPADFPREIPNHSVQLPRQNWPAFAHMGVTDAPVPPSGRTVPGCRRGRRGRQFGPESPGTGNPGASYSFSGVNSRRRAEPGTNLDSTAYTKTPKP